MQSRALGCGTQARARKKLFRTQGLRRSCPAQSPEVQRSHPFSGHFTEDLAQSLSLPLPAGFQRRPTSLLLPQANLSPRPAELFSPQGLRPDLRPAARGVSGSGGGGGGGPAHSGSVTSVALLSYVHPLTGSESHLRVPPRRPVVQGGRAGPLRAARPQGNAALGAGLPGLGARAGADGPGLWTCPGPGRGQSETGGDAGESAGGRPRSRRSLSPSVAQGAGQADCLSVWTPRGGKNRRGWSF